MILLHKTNVLEVVCEFNDMSNNAVRQNTSLLSFRHLLERCFLLGVLFQMKIFCSDWPYLIRNHLSFMFLCFILKYLHKN